MISEKDKPPMHSIEDENKHIDKAFNPYDGIPEEELTAK